LSNTNKLEEFSGTWKRIMSLRGKRTGQGPCYLRLKLNFTRISITVQEVLAILVPALEGHPVIIFFLTLNYSQASIFGFS
jgi:hypothetical protein